MDKAFRSKMGVAEEKPNDWFETLYSNSNESGEGVPWANMSPHPIFKDWLAQNKNCGEGKTALVIGCGMGDDAIALEQNGFSVTAFDVSESAIELCKKRFPQSEVNFVQADLIEGIPEWQGQFDFVLEIYTIQALPPKYESILIGHICDFVAEKGEILMISEIQNNKRTFEVGPPWLLNISYVDAFEQHGFKRTFYDHSNKPNMGDAIHLSIFEKQ
ncbi:MAG: class I SAM-dependent methyltransferase [Flavobacteriales bacterium]